MEVVVVVVSVEAAVVLMADSVVIAEAAVDSEVVVEVAAMLTSKLDRVTGLAAIVETATLDSVRHVTNAEHLAAEVVAAVVVPCEEAAMVLEAIDIDPTK